MTPQQQTDLTNWLKDTSQELPKSLDNLFMEDCLEEIAHNKKARDNFNLDFNYISNGISFYFDNIKTYEFFIGFSDDGEYNRYSIFEDLKLEQKIWSISKLLSTTPDGAVMPFLDVPIKYNKYTITPSNNCSIIQVDYSVKVKGNFKIESVTTLDHLLYREFTEALRIGKTLNEAWKIINKIYILNRYV
jgi:hypothetical protein